jgi:RimJ/RimL family protein N-acetyltransferase
MRKKGVHGDWQELLEGKTINLRIAEKEDVQLLSKWFNDVRFIGDYQAFPTQASEDQVEQQVLERRLYGHEWVDFIVEKKDGTSIGETVYYLVAPNFGWIEIGYAIVEGERGKGYGTEVIQVLTDYLFLSRDIPRIQAMISKSNLASKRVLEKAGFKKEGTMRMALWNSKGEWEDGCLYSILRNEWKEPRTLKPK